MQSVQTIWIARHGNRRDFVDPGWKRRAARPHDPPLSVDGLVQARELAQRLAREKIQYIFSSPFLRCLETANEVSKLLQLPIKVEYGLSEWLNIQWFPEWPQLLPTAALIRLFPGIDSDYPSRDRVAFPEKRSQMLNRTGRTVRRLVNRYRRDLLLVGHGASMAGAALQLLNDSPAGSSMLSLDHTPCCSLMKLSRRGSHGWRMDLNADTSHLSRISAGRQFA